jgi:uncharacterized repeat protein (TIGR04076 family)
MIPHSVRCEVTVVRTESGVCPGIAKTERGEVYVMDGRTPGERGICGQAFAAMNSFRTALMVTDKLDGEKDGGLEITCPHGAVTFRLSRAA